VRTHFVDEGVTEPQMSRDGRSLLYSKFDARKGAMDVWVRDVARGTSRRLTSGLANNFGGRWSPDAKRIAFLSDRAGMYDIYSVAPSGGAPSLVWQSGRDKQDASFAGDGRLIVMVDDPQTGGDLYWADQPSQPLHASPLHETDPAVSPDGRWIAYAVFGDTDDANQVHVVPAAGGAPIQISTNGGAHPVWSRDGSEIFYAARDRQVIAVPFRNGEAGAPQPLFRLPRTTSDHPFSLTPEGNFLIAVYDLEQTTVDRIEVLFNWREMLPR
jgi:Tol biopolymer transport system component